MSASGAAAEAGPTATTFQCCFKSLTAAALAGPDKRPSVLVSPSTVHWVITFSQVAQTPFMGVPTNEKQLLAVYQDNLKQISEMNATRGLFIWMNQHPELKALYQNLMETAAKFAQRATKGTRMEVESFKHLVVKAYEKMTEKDEESNKLMEQIAEQHEKMIELAEQIAEQGENLGLYY